MSVPAHRPAMSWGAPHTTYKHRHTPMSSKQTDSWFVEEVSSHPGRELGQPILQFLDWLQTRGDAQPPALQAGQRQLQALHHGGDI